MKEILFSDEFIDKMKSARKIVFFSGAGISAESGIPTFRGTGGIWNKMKPEELASFNAFMKNPKLVWDWYQYRRDIVHSTQPNPGHYAIAEMENYFPEVTVVTQNVDNLHRRAGSKTIYELHGNIEKNFCIQCSKRYDYINFPDADSSPRCDCGGLIRPDIVWFGEMLPDDQYSAAEKAARDCDILFVVGTSAVVYPAAYIPLIAKDNRKYLVEVNITETELSYKVDYSLPGKSGEILPRILELVKYIKT
ncbi:MAG: NAD-dependent deacetylase [Ignavibacteriaceae bacterium]